VGRGYVDRKDEIMEQQRTPVTPWTSSGTAIMDVALSSIKKKTLWPVVKLGEPLTYRPWEAIPVNVIVVKSTDLFNSRGGGARPIYYEILAQEGIHKYLGFNGKIILSSIMPDVTVKAVTKEIYADAVNKLGVDGYFTPDGETYLGEKHLGTYEVNRILQETEYLLKTCTKSKPIGLVKGYNSEQMRAHANALKALGICSMVFHAGDFSRGAEKDETKTGVRFGKDIRRIADTLYIYGVGSRKSLNFYSYADGYITQNHYVNAFYRQRLVDGKWRYSGKKADRNDIMQNLKRIHKEVVDLDIAVDAMRKIPRLSRWISDSIPISSISSGLTSIQNR
jgi:hypothetical protein